jgi:hypothetical protein
VLGNFHDPLVRGLLLIHLVSVGRLLLLLNNAILLFVGTGDPAIGFGRWEGFLCGPLPAHELGGEADGNGKRRQRET